MVKAAGEGFFALSMEEEEEEVMGSRAAAAEGGGMGSPEGRSATGTTAEASISDIMIIWFWGVVVLLETSRWEMSRCCCGNRETAVELEKEKRGNHSVNGKLPRVYPSVERTAEKLGNG